MAKTTDKPKSPTAKMTRQRDGILDMVAACASFHGWLSALTRSGGVPTSATRRLVHGSSGRCVYAVVTDAIGAAQIQALAELVGFGLAIGRAGLERKARVHAVVRSHRR